MASLHQLRAAAPRGLAGAAASSVSAHRAYGARASAGRCMMPGISVIPLFRTGAVDKVPAENFTIDCSPYKLGPEPPREVADRMEQTYRDMGVVRLTNTGLTRPEEMRAYASVIVDQQMTYDGGANPRVGILKNVYEVGAPNDAWLHYHHEMAYTRHSMKNIAFCSMQAPVGKGDTYLSENLSVTDELLATDFGRKLRDKGVCYTRCLTDREAYEGQGWAEGRPVYNHWQLSFGAETPEEAEEKAADCGLQVEWATDPLMPSSTRYMKTKIVISAFEFCPSVGCNVLFSSIADHSMWFDTWKGMTDIPHEKRPLQMTFGDGLPMSLDELQQWVRLYDRGGIRVQWQQGDVLAFCNYRFAHGRPAFELRPSEQRQLGVILGEKFERVGTLEAAWRPV